MIFHQFSLVRVRVRFKFNLRLIDSYQYYYNIALKVLMHQNVH